MPTNNHPENLFISKIQLPGSSIQYEIHDANAIHDIEDLKLAQALVFKGVKATESEIYAITEAKVGDVWLCSGNGQEYICVTAIDKTANAGAWEKLGNIHDAASSTHIHDVTVTGTNAASTVTGTVTVPTVGSTSKYIGAESTKPVATVTPDSVLGSDTSFDVTGGKATTTKISASASETAIGTTTETVVTGYPSPDSASFVTGGQVTIAGGTADNTKKLVTATIKNPSVTNINIPNVTSNEKVTASVVKSAGMVGAGAAASWSANVNNGVLSFAWSANTPTTVDLPTFDSVTATNTGLGSALSASQVSLSDITVATGKVTQSGTGDAVTTGIGTITAEFVPTTGLALTDLGDATTASVLKSAQISKQPVITLSSGTSGDVSVVTGVSDITVAANTNDLVSAAVSVDISTPAITLKENATGAIPLVTEVTVGTTDNAIKNGSAAAQVWTQTSGVTGLPSNS